MLLKTMEFIKRLVSEEGAEQEGSLAVTDPKALDKYIGDPSFPFLVSFPRTGSHWLRMLMELYFERPSLVRVFYFKDRKDYLCLHTHDMGLDVSRLNVIYLYRDPVPTVYSQMMYDKEDTADPARVEHWARYYGRHLDKWLLSEKVSEKKTIVRYERMMKDMPSEFAKITAHFGEALNTGKLASASSRVSKKEVKSKTAHDNQVVNMDAHYADAREAFSKKFGPLIEKVIFEASPGLKKFF